MAKYIFIIYKIQSDGYMLPVLPNNVKKTLKRINLLIIGVNFLAFITDNYTKIGFAVKMIKAKYANKIAIMPMRIKEWAIAFIVNSLYELITNQKYNDRTLYNHFSFKAY